MATTSQVQADRLEAAENALRADLNKFAEWDGSPVKPEDVEPPTPEKYAAALTRILCVEDDLEEEREYLRTFLPKLALDISKLVRRVERAIPERKPS